MHKKKLLIIYPYNFVKREHGIDTRYWELAVYLKKRDFSIDLFGIKNYISEWDEEEVKKSGLVDNLFLFDFKDTYQEPLKKKGKKKRTLKEKIEYRFKNGLLAGVLSYVSGRLDYMAKKRVKLPTLDMPEMIVEQLPDFAFDNMKVQLSHITSKTKYEFVLVGYVYWANLIHDEHLKDTVKVVDVNDFCTLQHFYLYDRKIKIGTLLEEEIRRINMFDKAMFISDDELMFFSQFAPDPEAFYVPQSFKKRSLQPVNDSTYDILYIGSNNPHNQKSIKWFFDEIYPLMPDNYHILIVGGITKFIGDYTNVTKIGFVDNLDEVYEKAKIAICPMIQGTGMKIKVVEALSYSKPVVCTRRGVDGFNQKRENGCTIAQTTTEFALAINKLLSDEVYYNQQKQLAENFFQKNLEESVVYQTLDSIFLPSDHEYKSKPAPSSLKAF